MHCSDMGRHTIETRCPVDDPVVRALSAYGDDGERFAEYVACALDQEDGWIYRTEPCWTWYPSRLAVELRCADNPAKPLLHVRTTVVENAEGTPELISCLNDLNVHSAGWWWWVDPIARTVNCSVTCVPSLGDWWWPRILLGVLPYFAAATESMADALARLSNGAVRTAMHPYKGVRASVDGWIVAARSGTREPCASLGLWLSDLELARLDASLDLLCSGLSHEVDRPLDVRVLDEDKQPRIALRRHWHPRDGLKMAVRDPDRNRG